MTRATVLGVPVDILTMDETLDRLEELIRAGGVHQHVVVNASKIVQASDDPQLTQTLRECDVVNADGMSVVWAARLLGVPVPERVAGIDVMDGLLVRAARSGYPVYFLGAASDVVQEVVRRSRQRYPGLQVAGFRDGYWRPADDAKVAEVVRASGAAILLVALPSPRKERFVAAYKEAMGVALVVGVGGSFDVFAGRITRAPRWMQRVGLEWLHRLAKEPRRMWRRYLIGNMRFLLLLAKELRRRS